MNNPRTLKVVIAVLTVALLASLLLIRYTTLQIYEWKDSVRGNAEINGLKKATDDFQAGKRRLYVIAGLNGEAKFTGSNDGPFEIWNPPWAPEPYKVRFEIETKWASYNERMRFLYDHPKYFDSTTNHPANLN